MKLSSVQQLILDLVNEYDTQGCILDEKLLFKYSKKINELVNNNDSNKIMD